MRACRPGAHEYEVQAELEYEFRRGGATTAYPPIVAGGANACVLHYVSNDAELRDGTLLLIDAGAEVDCYACDLTRTFPVNGRFSGPQRAVYEIVLAAQQAAIDCSLPGAHWNDPNDAAVRVLVQGMVDLKLLAGTVDGLIEAGAHKRFYMHRTGHWLGMDVHDVGDYKIETRWRQLEPGMVFTVEPGLYIRAGADIDERFHDLGVRIEDDVLITRDGPQVLTADAPKTVADIEAWMRGQD
jgi:Xaa-Pro aminopeptidase